MTGGWGAFVFSMDFDGTPEIRYISASDSGVLSNCEALRRSSAIDGRPPLNKLHWIGNGARGTHLPGGVSISLEITR